jgi:hypothetical protein
MHLEIGCTGNPLEEDYNKFHYLAMQSWIKSFWERLHHYQFVMPLGYKRLNLPRQNNALLVEMFWRAGFKNQLLQALNRCRIVHKLILLSHIATECGRALNLLFLTPPPLRAAEHCSLYVFPNKQPSHMDW